MKKIFLTMTGLFPAIWLAAQDPILRDVKIEYEKKVNIQATIPQGMGRNMMGNVPQYLSSFFTLETDGNHSVYKAVPSEKNNERGFWGMQQNSGDDIVYTDFVNQQQVSLKNVFEKTYLITDSVRHIDWKITNDFREIAGFNCRRATAVIMDSVFIVAFYTNEIIAPGGPESITGLPGTILGLVINRLHTTWYATRVSVVDVNTSQIVPPSPSKAEKTNKSKLIESLQDRFQGGGAGNFGNFRDRIIWGIMI